MDYQKAYKLLFNAITNALTTLDKASFIAPEQTSAERILQEAQQQTEEMFIQAK